MNSGNSRHVAALILVATVFAVVSAQPVHAAVESQSIGATVAGSTGEQYLAARAAALSLPTSDFGLVLAELRKAGPSSSGGVVASALEIRRASPELAQEFDGHVKETIERPDMSSRSGRPRYVVWWPNDRPDLDPLAFEVIVKRTVPDQMRQEFIVRMGRPNIGNVNAILAIADMEGVTYAGMLASAAVQSATEQDRATPIIVQIHKKWRAQGQVSSGGVFALATFGREPQLAALKEIRDFERQRASEEGITPWSAADVRKLYESALVDLNTAQVRLGVLQRDGGDAAGVRRADKDLQAMKAKADALQKRCHVRELWVELEQRIATLEAALASRTTNATGASTGK